MTDWREKALDDLIRDSEALRRRSRALILQAEVLRARCADLKDSLQPPASNPKLRRLK
jgi:hypothetical protein